MVKKAYPVLILIMLLSSSVAAQEIEYGFGFQTILRDNPAFSGSEGDALLRLSYINHYPGKNLNLQSFFLSFDSFIPVLHGGLGGYVSNDYLGGIINDLRGGFSYSYHLQADRDFYINAGLSASFFHRGLNRGNIVLPDQLDPLNGITLPTGEVLDIHGHTAFDIATGVMVFAGKYFGGLSISHLAQPDLTGNGLDVEQLKRKYQTYVAGVYNLGRNRDIRIIPVITAELQGDRISSGAGASLEASLITINSLLITGDEGDINLRSGFSIMKGTTGIYYNYTFNISSRNSLLPFSLSHQVGLSISLYNVDKRKTIKTIKFPNL